jgi:hypothetical protein
MNDNVRNHQRNWIQSLLKTKVCKVVFEKIDGSERTMICTLKEDLLPSSKTTKQPKTIKPLSETVMPVWDVEAQSWRSFRVDSVIEFSEYEKIEE